MLTGAGRAFCVGQDLREHVALLEAGDGRRCRRSASTTTRSRELIAGMPKPVIAAVRGMAAGAGASLALLADFRVGGPGTKFLMAFANVGLAGDTGVSWTLPRLVGHAKATELLMLAEPVDAATADRLGLLSRLVDDDEQVLPAAGAGRPAGRRPHRGVRADQARAGRRGRRHAAGDPRGRGRRPGRLRAHHRSPGIDGRLRAKQKPVYVGS